MTAGNNPKPPKLGSMERCDLRVSCRSCCGSQEFGSECSKAAPAEESSFFDDVMKIFD